jgi:hypothetical protein
MGVAVRQTPGVAGGEQRPLCGRAAYRLVFLLTLWYTFNGNIERIFEIAKTSSLRAFTSVDADRSEDR